MTSSTTSALLMIASATLLTNIVFQLGIGTFAWALFATAWLVFVYTRYRAQQ